MLTNVNALAAVYDRLEQISSHTAENRAAAILSGLQVPGSKVICAHSHAWVWCYVYIRHRKCPGILFCGWLELL